MNKALRLSLTLIALGAAALLIVMQFQRLLNDRSILQIDDFVEYWAAGRLNANGENPYDPAKLLPLELAAGRDTDEAVMMWNPPWTLSVAMPFGLMDSRTAQLLWLCLGFVFIVGGADLLWRLYGGPVESRWISWALAFTFMPTFFVLHAGQIGTWVFAGIVLFLYFQSRGWSMMAGAATVLLAIKPHLVYLFWITLIVWGIRRDRRLLLGGLIAGVVTTAIPLACNRDVVNQYWYELRHRPPAQWESPTLGTLIRMIEGESSDGKSRFGLTFLPAVLGVGWLVWKFKRTSPPGPLSETERGSQTSPPGPLSETERGSQTSPPGPLSETERGSQTSPRPPLRNGEGEEDRPPLRNGEGDEDLWFPLSVSERGSGGEVLPEVLARRDADVAPGFVCDGGLWGLAVRPGDPAARGDRHRGCDRSIQGPAAGSVGFGLLARD